MTYAGRLLSAFAALTLLAGAAAAQTYSLGTSQAGSLVNNLGLAIADAAQGAGLDLRITPFNSTTQALPLVASGDLTFGLANAYELQMADSGTVVFEGRAIDGLRLVTPLYPFRMSLMVRADSDIESFADLAGRRVPAGFGSTATGELLIGGMLGAGGISYDDVQQVTVSSFGDMRDAFEAGRTEAMITILGSGRDAQVAERVGGIRVLSLPGDAEAETRMQEFVPVARAEPALASEGITGLDEDIFALTYDYYLYTDEDTPDEVVTALLEAIVSGRDEIAAVIPPFAWFAPDQTVTTIGLPYHDGALAVAAPRPAD